MNRMTIRDEILREHSKAQAGKIADYACESSKNFQELIDCLLDNECVVAQRAAWSVSLATTKNPSLIQPYIGILVAQIQRTDVHDAVTRNSIRILEDLNIPEVFHGQVMNACFSFVETPSTAPAIKAFSLSVLYKLSLTYPEIKAELKLIIETQFNQEKPSFQSRGKRILRSL